MIHWPEWSGPCMRIWHYFFFQMPFRRNGLQYMVQEHLFLVAGKCAVFSAQDQQRTKVKESLDLIHNLINNFLIMISCRFEQNLWIFELGQTGPERSKAMWIFFFSFPQFWTLDHQILTSRTRGQGLNYFVCPKD